MILTIEGQPRRQFHRPRQTTLIDYTVAHHALLRSVSLLRDDSAGEVAHLTVELDNTGLACSAMFSTPPAAASAALTAAGDVFAGIVQAITITPDGCSLEIGA